MKQSLFFSVPTKSLCIYTHPTAQEMAPQAGILHSRQSHPTQAPGAPQGQGAVGAPAALPLPAPLPA